MNFYDPDGHLLDYRRIEELATRRRISLRTGCFCNPGAGETAEGLTEEDMLAGAAGGADMTLPRFMQVIQHRGGKSAGAIRVSLGIVSNFADVDRFVQFASEFRDQTRLTLGEVTFDIESLSHHTRRSSRRTSSFVVSFVQSFRFGSPTNVRTFVEASRSVERQ